MDARDGREGTLFTSRLQIRLSLVGEGQDSVVRSVGREREQGRALCGPARSVCVTIDVPKHSSFQNITA